MKNCSFCGKEFKEKNSRQRFCSDSCRLEDLKGPTKYCVICDKLFKGKGKTCSDSCRVSLQQLNLSGKSIEQFKKEKEERKTRTCVICGKLLEEFRQGNTCSSKCKSKLIGIKNSNKSKEERSKAKKKRDLTCIKKYGQVVDFRTKNNGKFIAGDKNNIDKIKKTCLEKYGVDWATKSIRVKSKIINTLTDPISNKERMNKIKETNLKKYGVPYILMLSRYRSHNVISNINLQLSKFLQQYNINNKLEFRINNYLYDLHILFSNILIEIDPTAYHNSSWHPHNKSPKDKYYHYNKTKLALDNGYICIHKFDWQSNEDILRIVECIDEYSIIQGEPRLHWYNIRTREHLLDNNLSKIKMIKDGFVEVYDDGVIY